MRCFFSLLLVLTASHLALASNFDADLYRNARIGLKFTAPPGWLISRQTGYPEIIALMTTKGENQAQLSVALDALDAHTTVRKLVAQSNLAMRAVGILVKSSGRAERLGRRVWRTVASAKRRGKAEMAIQQLYLPADSRVFVLTLSCPARTIQRHLPALDALLDSIEASPPKPRAGP